MISPSLNEKFYREYMTFFEQAERTRRWNPFTDIDWDALNGAPQDDAVALCAETFCGVEMYLPDYLSGTMCATPRAYGDRADRARHRPRG